MLKKIFTLFLIVALGFYLYTNFLKKEEQPVVVTETIHQTIVEKIEAMGKLELVKYQLKDVVEHKIVHARFIPDTKALVMVSGEAVGCIDLSQINSERVSVQGDTVYVRLPQPEICYYKIDHQNSRVISTEHTYYGTPKEQVIDAAYREAEKQMLQGALQMNILEQTRNNATVILRPMLEAVAGRTVILTYDMAIPEGTISKR
jgi:hypothetical protein